MGIIEAMLIFVGMLAVAGSISDVAKAIRYDASLRNRSARLERESVE